MSGRLMLSVLGGALALVLCTSPVLAVPQLPSLFVSENAAPGAVWDTPVAIAFFPGGRMLVAEKRGQLHTVKNGVKFPTPMWSRESDVLNNGDRGLLGIAVDPRYNGTTNRWIYLLYTVDPDSNGNDTNDDAFSRLIRVQVSAADSNVVDYATRQVLFGATWRTGPVSTSPSHTIGALRFGSDGSLLISSGDGAQFNSMDQGGQDAGAFGATRTDPNEDIGAFRAQDITSLCGKILRINPDNGQGYPSNPYWDGDPFSARSRVWVYGLRNPYRFSVRPSTGATDPAAGSPGTLYIGDVGWTAYEETDIARVKGLNFGWPCYEGFGQNGSYQAGNPAHNGCGSFGTPTNPVSQSPPNTAWHHGNGSLSTPTGITGNTATGGVFYTSNRFPVQYRNQYFYTDYGQSWLKVAVMDANDNLSQVLPFGTGMDGPVDINVEPATGDLIYVAINVGQVRRIRYTGAGGGNTNPVANGNATPVSGSAPLTVNFSSAGSADADGDPITFNWLFGDGGSSTQPNPSHVYTAPGTFSAQLTVSDNRGGSDTETIAITVSGASAAFPTTPVLDNFNRANGAIGGSWVDQLSGLTISASQLTSSTGQAVSPVWNGQVFGPDQEAYITFNAVNLFAHEHDLMLKVQGTSYTSGHIEVRYTAPLGQVQVSTFTQSTAWVNRGAPINVSFAAGDQLGARALANGTIEVYKNGVLIGSTTAGSWPYAANGGRLGLTLDGITTSLLDNFGGGTVVFGGGNTKPTATIIAPANNSFYVSGQTINLSGNGSDTQTPSDSLLNKWVMDLHHNTHVHPSSFVGTGKTQSYPGDNHDDGTGVYEEIKLIVTDKGGLTDTARVTIYPETDLTPSVATVTPPVPTAGQSATFSFRLRNLGRMPAPISRWVLRAGSTLIAQGDTLVAALDSVTITRTAVLPAGSYTLRARGDSLGTVFETSETNNASNAALVVNPAPGNNAPLANATGAPLTGTAPLMVNFSSAGSIDPDGDPITFGWAFGDGGTSSAANPSRSYVAPGTYNAILTVSDNRGGSGRDTVVVTVNPPPGGGFPTTAVLDNFNRANGSVGALWEPATGLTVNTNQLKPTTTGPSATWVTQIFGANQEVFLTLSTLNPAAEEHILMLKVQGHYWYSGHIEVNFEPSKNAVRVTTFAPAAGWVTRGSIPTTFANGDQLGARALANGNVTIYKNGAAIGTVSVGNWSFSASGGRIGLAFAVAQSCAYDNFGGGDAPAGAQAAAVYGEPAALERDEPSSPLTLALSSPYPNPARGAVAFALDLPREAAVEMSVHDLQGREIHSMQQHYGAGRWTLRWDGNTRSGPAAPGIYLVRVGVGERSFVRRIAMMR